MHTWAHKCMQPPAQALTIVFFCAAALIVRSMVQAKSDPPRAAHVRVRKKRVCALIDGCPAVQLVPPSTTSLVRGSMAARSAYANCTDALRCATRYRHTANMRTITASAPAPLPSHGARTRSRSTSPLCAVPLAQSFCREPSNISTLTSTTAGISEHFRTPSLPPPPLLLGVPGTLCVCSRRHDETIKSAPTVCSSASSAFVHPSFQAQACSLARKDGIPLTPRSHLGPFPLRPRSHSRPCPLCPIPTCRFPLSHSHSHLGTISPVGAAVETPSTLLKEPASTAELRAQDAERTAENAPYAGRASCTRRTASCTSCHVSCNAHLSHGAVRISICRAAHRQRSCQLALLGLAERAQHARATRQ
jgi:hypothetical protein